MADGSIEFKTNLDNSDLEKQLKEAERKISSLKRKIETEETNRSFLEKQMDRAEKALQAASAETERLRANIDDLRNADPSDSDKWFRAQREVDGLTQALERAEKREQELAASKLKLDEKWQLATDKITAYNERLASVSNRYQSLSAESQQAAAKSAPAWQQAGDDIKTKFSDVASSVRERMSGAASQAVSPWKSFASRVNTMLRKVFVFGVILAGLRAIKNELGSMLSQNRQFNASVENLKSVMRGFLGQMVQMVLPVLTGIVNTLAQAFQRIASFIDSLFGTNIMGSIEQQRQQSSDAIQRANAEKMADYDAKVAKERERYEKQVAAAEERQAKAAQKLEKAQKKANQQLFAFDELNKMAEDSSEDAADALDDYADAIEEPDYSGIEPPELETDWTQDLVPDAGVLQGVLDWLDMLRDRILNDVEGPFARIREGLELIKKGWDELVQGFATGDLGLIWQGIVDIIVGSLYVIEGAFGAFMDWLDELTGGRFHDVFEGLKLTVHGFVEFVEGLLRGDLPLAFQGITDMLDGISLTAKGVVDAISGFLHQGVDEMFAYLMEKMPQFKGPLSDLKQFAHDIINNISSFLRGQIDGDRQFIGGALDVIVGIFTLDAERIERGVSEMFEGIKTHLMSVIDFFKNNISNGISLLRNGVDRLFNFLSDKFPQLRGLFEGLRTFIGFILTDIDSRVRGVFNGIATALRGLMDGAKQIVNGAIEVIVGIFTGSGDRIVGGLKGIVNGFITVIEGVLDGAISGVVEFANGIVDGLSRLPGVSIPSISFHGVRLPRLAQGAVIPPNREFMAVLGDQRSGNNIETPESLMRQVVREESGVLLADALASLLGRDGGNAQDVVLMVGRRELARETLRGIRELQDTGELGTSGLIFT